ncbi:MAG: phytoene/squalene synthase family protein [Micropruina sp.]|nr:phytoene/squalene synthase family protein [Micropruina sp.]
MSRETQLLRRHGTTYWWGTLLLPRRQARDVAAIYAVCRVADDLVDEQPEVALATRDLYAYRDAFYAAWDGAPTDDSVLAAASEVVVRRRIPRHCFDRFFGAMALDLTRTSWASWPDLRDGYMEGSAAVIGELMVPVLEPRSQAAFEPARSLGLAFQLTNFIRDVGEDLGRGRVYLPADELAAFGADPWLRRVTPQWRAFLAAQIVRNRELYEAARPGIELLPPAAARCVAAAHGLYAQILDEIEAADYDVFSERRRVSRVTKAATVARLMASAR